MTPESTVTQSSTNKHEWQPLPAVGEFLQELLGKYQQSAVIDLVAKRLLSETGTRLEDWVDHYEFPVDEKTNARLIELGFSETTAGDGINFVHPGALVPRVKLIDENVLRLFLRVESVVDFLVANPAFFCSRLEGIPGSAMRRACVETSGGIELWVIERHGWTSDEVPDLSPLALGQTLVHQEAFRLRQRRLIDDADGFEHASTLIAAAIDDIGRDRACDLFFAAEREYWGKRNLAARVQKARQDAIGMGWANHDHHTYRSSRASFVRLIAVLEQLGFACRERFYAGREAGWGAQVLEHAGTGVVIFADVDLSPEEVAADFAHEPLPQRDSLGTVGLWCRLHGEAFLQAGMHHLECQFDFDAAREQLAELGVASMKPFTDLPYLKQAFTKGEWWSVDASRIDSLLNDGLITIEQAGLFRDKGALGIAPRGSRTRPRLQGLQPDRDQRDHSGDRP